MGEGINRILKLQLDRHLRLEFWGAKVTTDAGSLAVRELDGALELTEMAVETIEDKRTGRNVQYDAAFASPDIHGYLEENGILYAIRIKARNNLYRETFHLITKTAGRLSKKPKVAKVISHSRRTIF